MSYTSSLFFPLPHPSPLQGLERGECEAAASVGVNLALVHSWTRACLRAGMLSEDGRCKTLDSGAGAARGAVSFRDTCWS